MTFPLPEQAGFLIDVPTKRLISTERVGYIGRVVNSSSGIPSSMMCRVPFGTVCSRSTHHRVATQMTDAAAALDDAGLHDGDQAFTVLQY